LRECEQCRIEARETHQHARLHVRDALSPAHHPIRRRASDPPGRLHGLLEGSEEAFQSQATETEMKLASLKGGRDGHLVVVSRDLSRAVDASAVAPTLREALDDWPAAEPRLQEIADSLEAGRIAHTSFDPHKCAAPLP